MKLFKKIASFVLASGVFFSSSVFADTVKIAFIDPLSGPFATTGTIGLAEWKFAVEKLVGSLKPAACIQELLGWQTERERETRVAAEKQEAARRSA